MDDPLILEVLDWLDADAETTGMVESLVLGSLLGRLDEVIEDANVERPEAAGEEREPPVSAYLESVAVTGFRGIGSTCELRLQPGPGLTLVVGRNGSGKSSIAEAAEFAMTGDSRRWSDRSADWRKGWRNLHSDKNPTIAVNLRIEGERQPRTVRVKWSSEDLDAAETEVTVPGQGRQSLESLGWSAAVKTFRPFLSYRELSQMVEGRPVDRYNELAPMLGLESLQTPVGNLSEARLAADNQHKTAVQHVNGVIKNLRSSLDRRAVTAIEALDEGWDLDKIEALLTGADPATAKAESLLAALEQLPCPDLDQVEAAASDLLEAAERLEALQGSDAGRADTLAGLLEAAVEMHEQHGDADCPVCGRHDGLHSARVATLRKEITALRQQARAVNEAQRASRNARLAARAAVGTVPEALNTAERSNLGDHLSELLSKLNEAWSAWTDAPSDDADLAAHLDSMCLPVIEATGPVRSAAYGRRQQLASQWHPIAVELAEMLPVARQGLQAKERLAPLKDAERWIKICQSAIRDERFDVIKAHVKKVWDTLAVGSNVTLEDVRLGTKKGRHGGGCRRQRQCRARGDVARRTPCPRVEPVHPSREVRGEPVPVRHARRSRPSDGPGEGRWPGQRARRPREGTPSGRVHPRRPAAGGRAPTSDSRDGVGCHPAAGLSGGVKEVAGSCGRCD